VPAETGEVTPNVKVAGVDDRHKAAVFFGHLETEALESDSSS
jgi:hypothetical protein